MERENTGVSLIGRTQRRRRCYSRSSRELRNGPLIYRLVWQTVDLHGAVRFRYGPKTKNCLTESQPCCRLHFQGEALTISEIANAYVTLLWNSFQVDLHVFSQWWLYAPLFIPAIGYAVFFFLKWGILLIPIWLPLNFIFGGVRAFLSPITLIVKQSAKRGKQ